MSLFKNFILNNLYFKFVYEIVRSYTNVKSIYNIYVTKYFERLNKHIYGHSIIEVNMYDTILLEKKTLYNINWLRYLYHICLLVTNQEKLKTVIIKDFEVEKSNSNNLHDRPIYEIKYNNGKTILVRSEIDKKFIQPELLQCNHHRNKYIYATINEVCDITHFVNEHIGSFNDHLELKPIELASIAFIKNMINYDAYVNLLKDNEIFVFLINNDSLEETVFKDNDILIL